jgi:hypothetical protein
VSPSLTPREVLWGAGWAVAIAVLQGLAWGLERADLVQFYIQFGLTAAALTVAGLLLLNLSPKRTGRRLPLRWQVVLLLAVASSIAVFPWNSPEVGCLEC